MPELPEVETTKRGIEPHIVGKKISDIVIREKRFRWPIQNCLKKNITGKIILSISRRSKYILFHLENGCFMIHLGMSGSLRIITNDQPIKKHDHIDIQVNENKIIRFNDPRRFGSLLWLGKQPYKHFLLNKLGPEPLSEEFTSDYLFNKSRNRKLPIKNFIMNNNIVVGVGNIYANEALFISGIRPSKPTYRVTKKDFEKLTDAIVKVLTLSIEMGGTTLKDFVDSSGNPGYFQQTLFVYGRNKMLCKICSNKIHLQHIGQRSSYFCKNCQK